MASIFTSVLHAKFWHRTVLTPDTQLPLPLLTGTLKTKSGSLTKSYQYELYPYQLLCRCTQKPKTKFADLAFRTLSAFVQMQNSVQEFGFCISNKEFFVESESELNFWLKLLRPMCVLNKIEEDFVVIKEIGKGSTCTVYLAKSLETQENFAIKSIPMSRIKEHQAGVDNVIEEISILQELNNERIAKLLFVYESRESIDLVVEYMPGGSLCDLMNKIKKVEEKAAKKILKDLLETLQYMHSKQIVHRDLKLENIILTGKNGFEFKIIDFGIAFEGAKDDSKCGSPGYVAPEVMMGESYDSKIDVYSAGVVLFVLLCGKHPFSDRNEDRVMKKNLKGKYSITKSLSREAKDVIKAMMQPDPELRMSVPELLKMPWLEGDKDCNSALITS